MKQFDVSDYMKPMISKPGMIASRRNKYYLRAIAKFFSNNIPQESIPEYKLAKLPMLPPVKKRKKITESYSFKAVGRNDNEKTESPPPNRYSPKYEYLYKQNPRVIFGKQKIRDVYDIRSKSSEAVNSKSIDIPHKIQGIPFEKQISRKTIISGENPHEKRFERGQHSSFEVLNRIHSFSSYTHRKPLYESFTYQPDYSPKYSFISKHFKNNQLLE